MGNYATNADVLARFPGRALSGSTVPSISTVDAWIVQAEAEIDASLLTQGLTVPVVDTKGKAILLAKVASYAAARWSDGAASVSNSPEEHARAAAWMAEYSDFVGLIRSDLSLVASMLGQAPGQTDGSTAVRSNVTDNPDGLTIANGDFNPTFKRGMSW